MELQLPPTTEIQIQQQQIKTIRPLTEEEKLLYNNAEIDVDKTVNELLEELQQKKQKDTQDLLQHLDNSILKSIAIPLQKIQPQIIKDIKTNIQTLKSNYQTNTNAIEMLSDTILGLQEQKDNLQRELERGLLANEKSMATISECARALEKRISDHNTLINAYNSLYKLHDSSLALMDTMLIEQQLSINRLQNWLIALTGGSVLALTIWLWLYTHK